MYLEANTIFDNRYRLVLLLGQGASAQVWLADDTLSNNLRVAIKIFNAVGSELDSYGKQDFQKEFTTVYNINHQNLLTPTNYSLYEGTPYLVLPYCENGSTSSMVGRCEEGDVIKLLHDVAAGLDYLHRHGVIHQDIKPDNIMLDDDLNYLVTDFGISTGRGAATESYGGTRAYMAPERFSGRSDAAGDVWSLGATAYEMLTGNAPFGDHGGLVQAQGEPVPPIDSMDLSPEFVALLNSTLNQNPDKRPTADQIRRITERKLETGSWKEPRADNRTLRIGTIAIALIVVAAGVFTWGKLRTKTYYYSDYVEVNGAPVGIGSLFGSEQRARAFSYRIQERNGKVLRVSLVNGHGKIVDYHAAEHLGMRFPDQEYHYKADGTVDYMIARNPAGKVLYKFTYSDNNKVVETHYDDERNTPKFFSGVQIETVPTVGSENTTANIASMQLKYDSNDRLIERTYLSLLKHPTADTNGAYGEQYKYDSEGRVTEVITIDEDGNPVADANGTASRHYKYDENGNRVQVSFFGIDGEPAQDKHGIHLARLEYDEVGNIAAERYFNIKDDPMTSATSGAAGYTYTYDDNGFCTSTTSIDTDGEPTFIDDGYVTARYEDDGNGFAARVTLLDDEGNPITAKYDGLYCAGIKATFNDVGLATESTVLDEDGNPTSDLDGISTRKTTYNETGDELSNAYFDVDGNPCGVKRGYKDCRSEYEYDDLGRCTLARNFDGDGNPVSGQQGISILRIKYTPYGTISSLSCYDTDDKPANNSNGFSICEYEYDDQGRNTGMRYLDADKHLVESNDIARYEYEFDENSSRLRATRMYNAADKLVKTYHSDLDPATGRLRAEWTTTPSGALVSGTAKYHYEYDDMGHTTRVWTTDLSNRPINTKIKIVTKEDVTAGEIRYTYDNAGNCTSFSIWKADHTPGTRHDGTHRATFKYDNRNRIVEIFNYQSNGSPIKPQAKVADNQPEIHNEYDNRNNRIGVAVFDGHGKPINTPTGWHRLTITYDNLRNRTSRNTYNTAGNLVNLSEDFNCAKLGWEYDEYGNPVKETYTGADGRLKNAVVYKYNPNGKIISLDILNAGGKADDSLYGFSHIDYTVAPDGITYLTTTWKNSAGSTVRTGKWNKDKEEWDMSAVGGGGGWTSNIQAIASICPMQLAEGVVLRTVQYDSSSVTYVIACKTISGNDYDRSTLNDVANALIQMTHSEWNVPYSVSVHVRILNRENNVIFSK